MGVRAIIKGYVGETVNMLMLQRLSQDEYRVINNVILRDADGNTTQIDHVIVSGYGIFVIETKNYKGKIYGTDQAGQWTQYLGKKSYSFMNPLHQNYKHILALQKMTGLEKSAFISIIAFSGNAQLKVKTQAHVVSFGEVVPTIRQYQQNRIEKSMIDYYDEWIRRANNTGIMNQIRHVQNVKGNAEQKEKMIRSGTCPKCGGSLVRRNGKNGEFMGCLNYPKCRYTVQAGVVYPPNASGIPKKYTKKDVASIKTIHAAPPTSKAIEKELLQIKKELGIL